MQKIVFKPYKFVIVFFLGQCESSLDDFECDCGFDFSGEQCETSADDCAGVSCLGGATCMDGIGKLS